MQDQVKGHRLERRYILNQLEMPFHSSCEEIKEKALWLRNYLAQVLREGGEKVPRGFLTRRQETTAYLCIKNLSLRNLQASYQELVDCIENDRRNLNEPLCAEEITVVRLLAKAILRFDSWQKESPAINYINPDSGNKIFTSLD